MAALPAWADEAPEGALLLRNGEVFQGRILLEGSEFRVLLSHGEVRFPVVEVECAAATLGELYQRKQVMVMPGDARERLRLAQWCIRQGLLDEAAAEIARARSEDPTNPGADLLAHRLDLARQPLAVAKPPAVTPVVHTEAQLDELDRFARALPEGTVETFTQRVQPIMMNACATAACHGSQSPSKLQLQRVPGARPATRRLTQRNLQSVLPWVNREQPGGSRLLQCAVSAHGSAKTAPVSAESAQYRWLVEWVYQVARAENRVPRIDTQVVTAAATMPAVKDDVHTDAVQASWPAAEVPAEAPVQTPFQQAEPAPPPAAPARGADPFDPEVFNRRFLKD